MKNIHLLPTDKPSRLFLKENTLLLNNQYTLQEVFPKGKCQNIYITSDEEIKKDECYLGEDNNIYYLVTTVNFNGKKIILTTDIDLIKDGVQAIDDDFLEWFVKNPSCERVEVVSLRKSSGYYDEKGVWHWDFLAYKIIIPKEEPKQETLEEVAKKYVNGRCTGGIMERALLSAIEFGAKWQQEQNKKLYSEEDMLNFAWFLKENVGQYSCDRTAHFEGKYLEQFKNK